MEESGEDAWSIAKRRKDGDQESKNGGRVSMDLGRLRQGDKYPQFIQKQSQSKTYSQGQWWDGRE